MPPEFLEGSCDAHPANDEKRHRLYRLFWCLLTDMCFFRDPEYLRRKEGRTVRDDRREILPMCIVEVTVMLLARFVVVNIHIPRRFEDGTPATTENTGITCLLLMQRLYSS